MSEKYKGILGKNDFRKEGSNQPEYTGKCTINGTEYKIGAWVKESEKEGKTRKYFSLSFEEVSDAQEPKKKDIVEMDSDIPW